MMGPEPDFNDLWDTKWPGPKVSGNLKPRPPRDRPVPKPRRKRTETVGGFSTYIRDKQESRLKRLQQRVQEENEKKYAFERRIDKIKGIIMNIILPAFVILSILLGGAITMMPDKKPEQFQEKRTLQVQEAPKKGSPTITRSE